MADEKKSNRKKILIIEDEIVLAKNLVLALSDDYDVFSAITANEGLAKLKKQLPELLLLDIMLPDKSGIEVLKELKRDPATEHIKVLVLSNLSDGETVSNILAAGGTEYLVKSDWSINQVVEKVKLAIG